MSYCPNCNEYHYSFDPKPHVCAPKWNVWIEGEEEGFDLNASREVYAHTAKDAALGFADNMYASGEVQAWTVYVRRADEENPRAECFSLDYYTQPVFEANRSKKQPYL